MTKFATFLKARVRVLEHMVEGGVVSDTLDVLCRDTEIIDPAMRCSVLYFDKDTKRLRHAAAPSLPDYYNNAIDGIQAGLGMGSCGTAAYTGERVIVEDVYSHPYWESYRDLAKKVGFHACWSQPIYSKSKEVLGTFAMYFDEVRQPTEEEIQIIEAQANLASLAIQRLRSEEALRESERQKRQILEMLPDLIWLKDVEGNYITCNPACERLFGVKETEIIGKTDYDLLDVEVANSFRQHDIAAMEAGQPLSYEEWITFVDTGIRALMETIKTPLKNNDGTIVGILGIGRDITERNNAENLLHQAKIDAEQANASKSEFLASMSHELRTPLNAVLGFAQMLQYDTSNQLSPMQNEHIDCILDGGNHLLELVNEILDLSKIEANQLDLFLEDVNVSEVVTRCISMATSLGESRDIKIVDQLSGRSPAHLRTDRMRLKQILLNLISNAIKFNKDGGTVRVDSWETDDGFLRISVSDTGVGIAKEDYPKVFQMFHRLGADSMIAREGTGIGLTVTKLLVERMAGQVGFESEEGIGSTFWAKLPLASNEGVLIWSDTLRVGVNAIDKDHQKIISLMNKAMHGTADDWDLAEFIEGLIDYSQYHFRREEAVMEVCGYQGLETHRGLHREFTTQVNVLADTWRKDRDPKLLHSLNKVLRHLLIDHIVKVDTEIAMITRGKDKDIQKALGSLE